MKSMKSTKKTKKTKKTITKNNPLGFPPNFLEDIAASLPSFQELKSLKKGKTGE